MKNISKMMMVVMMMMMMMMMMMIYPWLESSWWWVGTERHCPKVDSKSFYKDSELGQLLMTCGKVSNQAPAVNNMLSG